MQIHDTRSKRGMTTPTPFFEINDVASKIPNKCSTYLLSCLVPCLSSSLMMSGAFVGYTLFLLLFPCHIGRGILYFIHYLCEVRRSDGASGQDVLVHCVSK